MTDKNDRTSKPRRRGDAVSQDRGRTAARGAAGAGARAGRRRAAHPRPLRHLQAIEDGDYGAMPTPTYAVGFAKAYARAVGEDEVEIAREVRGRAEVTAARRPNISPMKSTNRRGAIARGDAGRDRLAVAGADRGRAVVRHRPVPRRRPRRPAPGRDARASPRGRRRRRLRGTARPPARSRWSRPTKCGCGSTTPPARRSILGTWPGERYDVPAGRQRSDDQRRPSRQIAGAGERIGGRAARQRQRAIKDVGIGAAALAARGQPASRAAATATARSPTGFHASHVQPAARIAEPVGRAVASRLRPPGPPDPHSATASAATAIRRRRCNAVRRGRGDAGRARALRLAGCIGSCTRQRHRGAGGVTMRKFVLIGLWPRSRLAGTARRATTSTAGSIGWSARCGRFSARSSRAARAVCRARHLRARRRDLPRDARDQPGHRP